MRNTLKINHTNGTIIMDRTFAKLAENTFSAEYRHLQKIRADYPDYRVVRKTIKKNANKETYKGLTYEYMEKYINTHDDAEAKMKEYQNLRGLSEEAQAALAEPCSYNEIRAWFLKTYPAIAKFHEDRAKLLAA